MKNIKNNALLLWGLTLAIYASAALAPPHLTASTTEATSTVDEKAPFITVWRMDGDNRLILPLRRGRRYDFTVHWGDDSQPQQVISFDDPNSVHTYKKSGDYVVTITGTVSAWDGLPIGHTDRLIEVKQLGKVGWRNLWGAFHSNKKLEKFNAGNTDTSQVISMAIMFAGTSSLTHADVSSFDTSSVESMVYMFYGASKLTAVDVSNFNTSRVKDIGGMFYDASSLTSIDVSNFDTSNVRDMGSMFANTSSLTSIDVSNFDTSNVSRMVSMFRGASSLTSLDVSNFDTSNVRFAVNIFKDMTNLTQLNLSGWDLKSLDKNSSSLILSGSTPEDDKLTLICDPQSIVGPVHGRTCDL